MYNWIPIIAATSLCLSTASAVPIDLVKRYVDNPTANSSNSSVYGQSKFQSVSEKNLASTYYSTDSNGSKYIQWNFTVTSMNVTQSVSSSKLKAISVDDTTSSSSSSSASSTSSSTANSAIDKVSHFMGNLLKRTDSESMTIENQQTFYSVELSMGSREQKVEVLLDTGSADLWVPTMQLSEDLGYFTPAQSTSYRTISTGFSITYGDGTHAYGDWATDVIKMGDISVTNVTMGVCNQVTAAQGVLGLGFQGNEVASNKYPNFPMLLHSQGLLDTISYSLYLNTAASTSGTILFGAIDTEKYEGDLVKLPVLHINDGGNPTAVPVAFFVNLVSITGQTKHNIPTLFTSDESSSSSSSASVSHPALLDSGTTLINAPNSVYKAIGSAYGYHLPKLGYVEACDHWDEITSLSNMLHMDDEPAWHPKSQERCFVYHGPVLYDSTIKFLHQANSEDIIGKKQEAFSLKEQVDGNKIHGLPSRLMGVEAYYIHYKNWPKAWDEWVDISRMLPYNSENIRKCKELLANAINSRGRVEIEVSEDRYRDEANDSRTSSNARTRTRTSNSKDSSTSENSDDQGIQKFFPSRRLDDDDSFIKIQRFLVKAPFIIDIPQVLRRKLVGDCQNVKLRNMLVKIPVNISIIKILDRYTKYYAAKVRKLESSGSWSGNSGGSNRRVSTRVSRTVENARANNTNITNDNNFMVYSEFLSEFVDSIKKFLMRSFRNLVLYGFEHQQLDDYLKKKTRADKSTVILEAYGIEHFLRFLMILPSLICEYLVDDQAREISKFFIQSIVDFVSLKREDFFPLDKGIQEDLIDDNQGNYYRAPGNYKVNA
ncbi:hypothetical protein DASC09_048460 [Saccharomycopsis crataegensis]|uniref:Chromatin modification-related protein EAF3 n=1 Tax=Saccharomycopsis crataegensis TaxID=43959 RepID=A0AAV5QSM0_9ASCO|nr:hypothetical protein DASC09_048460 [Saccharomycopsis crataegensis]